MNAAPAIEVRDLAKRFLVPAEERPTRRARLRHPFTALSEDLEVLKDISFDVAQGEFFGIVGQNGSGKSTLMKLLASVYRADRGTIRYAGRLAPFLELGAGFNPALPAYENVVLNGVAMGLSIEQARSRYERVIEFAGLEEHQQQPLKNYSSGMKVRLAFAVLTQVDADILLLDEVLAVGDFEFQEKCEDEFDRMRQEGRTIVLVTHSMAVVTARCDRAMLINDGRIAAIGDPIEIANRYVEVNVSAGAASAARGREHAERYAAALADPPAEVSGATMIGADGKPVEELQVGEPIRVTAEVELNRDLRDPGIRIGIHTTAGYTLSDSGVIDLTVNGDPAPIDKPFEITARSPNVLASGSYIWSCRVVERRPDGDDEPVTRIVAIPFRVTGDGTAGPLALDHEVEIGDADAGDD